MHPIHWIVVHFSIALLCACRSVLPHLIRTLLGILASHRHSDYPI